MIYSHISNVNLRKTLNLTQNEELILGFFNFYNNRNLKNYKIPLKDIAIHLNIARTYFHKCIKSLVKKNLLVKNPSLNEYETSNFYKEVKNKVTCCGKLQKNNSELTNSLSKTISKNTKYSSNKTQKTQKNLETKKYEKDTKESLFETPPFLYIDNRYYSMSNKTHRVNNNKSKISVVNIFDLCEGFKKSECKSLDNYIIPKSFISQFYHILKDEIENAKSIDITEIKQKLNKQEYQMLIQYLNELAKTGIFTLKENKELMIKTIYHLIDRKVNILDCIQFSSENRLLWLCDNEFGYKALNNVWNLLKAKSKANKQKTISYIFEKYKNEINKFITINKNRGIFYKKTILNSLYLKLAYFEHSGINVIDSINQSIKNNYKWIFPCREKIS